MEQLKSGAQLEPRKYWGFKFITLYLPIIILVCVLSLVSVKVGVFLAAVLSTILVLKLPQFDGLITNETMSQVGETDDKTKPQNIHRRV